MSASLYQQEMARRGLTLPKKQPTPRKVLAPSPSFAESQTLPESQTRRSEHRAARYAEMRKLYVTDGLSLPDVAQVTGYSVGGVARALRKMGVAMRPRGVVDLNTLSMENRRLRARVAELWARLKKVEAA